MLRGSIGTTAHASAAVLALLAWASVSYASSCPTAGATLRVTLEPADESPPATVTVFGFVASPSCESEDASLDPTYAETLTCDPATPASCTVTVQGLQPGQWTHNIVVTAGEPIGQFQGRAGLLLAVSRPLASA